MQEEKKDCLDFLNGRIEFLRREILRGRDEENSETCDELESICDIFERLTTHLEEYDTDDGVPRCTTNATNVLFAVALEFMDDPADSHILFDMMMKLFTEYKQMQYREKKRRAADA